MTVSITVGTRFPAYTTSMGRVQLAYLPETELDRRLNRVEPRKWTSHTITSISALRAEPVRVRDQGYAIIDQELEEGLRSIAAPVRDRNGKVVAAINIAVHASRNSVESMRRDFAPHLLATAARIESDLRVVPTSELRRAAGG